MAKIRVLIVDDSVVIRRMLANSLGADADIEVVGSAANGQIALSRIPQLTPDLVTLDVEMPVMDGLQTLAAIRKTHPRLPVIMFSVATERGAAVTIDALAAGANDYVNKPDCIADVAGALQSIRDELVPKIKALCRPKEKAAPSARPAPPAATSPSATSAPPAPMVARTARTNSPGVLAIGVSTGGPNALAELLPSLPASFPLPIVIVQHMPPLFTRLLAERISSVATLPAHEGTAGVSIQPGHIYLAPGGHHMEVERTADGVRLALHDGPLENSCRPAVDVLFRSIARTYGAQSLALVLTGMGQDGLLGAQAIRAAGGQILIQDEASSVVWGMPGAIFHAGLAHKVLPLSELAAEVTRRTQAPPSISASTLRNPSLPVPAHCP